MDMFLMRNFHLRFSGGKKQRKHDGVGDEEEEKEKEEEEKSNRSKHYGI
jgi:hypothetical protein